MQVTREPPPLSGGYEVRDEVYYQGASKTLDNGPHAGHDKLVHGQHGEVVGPAILESHKGKGVTVLFHGNKLCNECPLTEVRRLHAASASPFRPPPTPPHLPAHAPPPLHRPGAPTPRGKRRRAPRGRTPRAGAVVAACVVRGCGREAASEGGGRASPVHGCGLGARR